MGRSLVIPGLDFCRCSMEVQKCEDDNLIVYLENKYTQHCETFNIGLLILKKNSNRQ